MIEPIVIDRSINMNSFPNLEGDIRFSVVEKGERSNVCKRKPEAYVIDTQSDWNTITEKIIADCNGNPRKSPLPSIDLKNNSILAYFWGEKPDSGNTFSIMNVQGDPNTFSIFVNLEFEDGILEALSYRYIIATIPKTAYKRFVFGYNTP